MRQHKVFVYGTLMRGETNHHLLQNARPLGPARTPPRYRLFSLGSYPVICPGGRQSVKGEVYSISQRGLSQLDELEEYPRCYSRSTIDTAYGPAWVYYQRRPESGARLVRTGDWRRFGNRRLHGAHRFGSGAQSPAEIQAEAIDTAENENGSEIQAET